MEVVGSRKSWGIREKRPRKRKLSFHTYARRGCKREKKKIEGEIEREKERRRKRKRRNGKTSWKAEAVKVRSWLEVGSWAEERRENERMRELRVFRQLGKPSRDRSREDFFSGNTFSFPHLSPLSFLSRAPVSFLYFSPAARSPSSVYFTTFAGPNLSRTD